MTSNFMFVFIVMSLTHLNLIRLHNRKKNVLFTINSQMNTRKKKMCKQCFNRNDEK